MAKETLSVDLDAALVERVRQYSHNRGADVADVLGELIAELPVNGASANCVAQESANQASADEEWERGLPPITRRLLGAASPGPGEEEYREYLWQKYGR